MYNPREGKRFVHIETHNDVCCECTRGRTAAAAPRPALSASSEIQPASSWAEEDLPYTPEGSQGEIHSRHIQRLRD